MYELDNKSIEAVSAGDALESGGYGVGYAIGYVLFGGAGRDLGYLVTQKSELDQFGPISFGPTPQRGLYDEKQLF